MIGVAIAGGIAAGAALAALLRRERTAQLGALGVCALALAVAFALAGYLLPALGALLIGGAGEVAVAAALTEVPRAERKPAAPSGVNLLFLALAAVPAVAAGALLLGAGISSRTALQGPHLSAPALRLVGRQLLSGAGVSFVVVAVLLAAVMIGGAALIHRDRREVAETQAEAQRRRRLEAQRERQRRREQARAAARAARRGSGR